MSKEMKQLQMDSFRSTFSDLRDLVVMQIIGMDVQEENKSRLTLRKKDIRLHTVKNSLARRVFSEMNVALNDVWNGPTTIAWGSSSLADLSKELDTMFKKNKGVQFKAAVIEGQQISFDQALKMPTREEALGIVIGMLLGPAGSVISQITGPGSTFVSQMKVKAEEAGKSSE